MWKIPVTGYSMQMCYGFNWSNFQIQSIRLATQYIEKTNRGIARQKEILFETNSMGNDQPSES